MSGDKKINQSVNLRLLRLRMELYVAAQTLKGEDAKEFWKLIDEIVSIRKAYE